MTVDRVAEENAIRALFAELLAAWTAGDAERYGACFTEDSDYVSYDGARAEGRAPMVANHDKLFRGVLRGSALVGDLESIRFLTDDVAIAHATGSVLMPWRRRLPRRRLSRQTLVVVKTADGWRFAALHNSRVRPLRIPEPTSPPARASQLLATLARAVLRRGPSGRPDHPGLATS